MRFYHNLPPKLLILSVILLFFLGWSSSPLSAEEVKIRLSEGQRAVVGDGLYTEGETEEAAPQPTLGEGISTENETEEEPEASPAGEQQPAVSEEDSSAEEQQYTVHFVERGEILWSLAREYDTSVDHLVEINAISDPNNIPTGMALLVPAGSDTDQFYTTHQIREGEEAEDIATSYGLTTSALLELNNMEDEKLTPGTTLVVPEPRAQPGEEPAEETEERGEVFSSAPGLILPDYRILIPREEMELGELEEKYDIDPERVTRINGLYGDKIQAGQKLILPTEANDARLLRFYMVQPGEQSLTHIASRFRFDYDWVAKANSHINPRELEPGEIIYLPSIKGEILRGEIPFESLTGDELEAGSWAADREYSENMFLKVVTQHEDTLPRPEGKPLITPDINFDDKFLIYTYLGNYPTTGYAVAIDTIEQENGEITVHLNTQSPGKADIVGQALTYPYDIAVIERGDLLVRGMLAVRFVDHTGEILDEQRILVR